MFHSNRNFKENMFLYYQYHFDWMEDVLCLIIYEDNMMSKVSRCVDNNNKINRRMQIQSCRIQTKAYFENLTKIIIVKSFSLALSIPLHLFSCLATRRRWGNRVGGEGETEQEERGKQSRRRGGERRITRVGLSNNFSQVKVRPIERKFLCVTPDKT